MPTGGGSESFEEHADDFERMRESVTRWNEEKTEENARDLFDGLDWWSELGEIERGTENLPTVGEIGWIEGKVWHPIPLVHHFPLALPQEYSISASRVCDGEWETIVGTQIGGFTRSDFRLSWFGDSIALDGRSTFLLERKFISARLSARIAQKESSTSFMDLHCQSHEILGLAFIRSA